MTRRAWLRVGVSLGLLAPLVAVADLRQVAATIGGAAPGLVAAAVVIAAVQFVLAAYRWFVLVRSHHRIGFGAVLRVTFISAFFGFFLPNGSVELVRLYGLSRADPKVGWVVASVVVERVLGLLALAVLALVGLLTTRIEGVPASLAVAAAVVLAVLLGLVPLGLAPPLRRAVLAPLSRPRLQRLRAGVERFYRDLDAMRRAPRALAWVVVLTVACQAARIAIAVMCARAIGVELPLMHFVALMPAVIFATLMPLSIGGLGVREATFVGLFALAGLPAATGLAVASLMLVANIAASLPGLAWALLPAQAFEDKRKGARP